MKLLLEVWVPGVPRTKGSLDPRMQDTPLSKIWRRTVAREVRERWTGLPFVEPVNACCFFVVPPPVGGLRSEPLAATHVGAGDLDKLERNVWDALGCTRADDACMIADDNLIVSSWPGSCKVVDDGYVGPGVLITVHAFGEGDMARVMGAALRDVREVIDHG